MDNRQRVLAVLNGGGYDRLPLLHFGVWGETVSRWLADGDIAPEDAGGGFWQKLGFDTSFGTCVGYCYDGDFGLCPPFESRVLRTDADGGEYIRSNYGVVIYRAPGTDSIPCEIEPLLTDRKSWEEHYRRRLRLTPERMARFTLSLNGETLPLAEYARRQREERLFPRAVACGSVLGEIRTLLGVPGMSYLAVDDPGLLAEIIAAYGEMYFQRLEAVLAAGIVPEMGGWWEDICFNHGPLVSPVLFREYAVPVYRRAVERLKQAGATLFYADCDGRIDALIPLFLEAGVNVMFPIEIGTCEPDYPAWRRTFGPELRGVGGMDKRVLAQDRAAVDREIERLKSWVDAGCFIPCPDHLLPPETSYALVAYYVEKMRKTFG